MKGKRNPVAQHMNELSRSEKKKLYDRERYHRNKETIKARSLTYYYMYLEDVSAKQRARREANYERHMLSVCKSRCKQYNIPFDLDVSDIVIPDVCPLFGTTLTRQQGNGRAYPNTASLDRIDPTKGYVKGNVQVISQRANRMKNDASQEELVYFAKSVLRMYERTT